MRQVSLWFESAACSAAASPLNLAASACSEACVASSTSASLINIVVRSRFLILHFSAATLLRSRRLRRRSSSFVGSCTSVLPPQKAHGDLCCGGGSTRCWTFLRRPCRTLLPDSPDTCAAMLARVSRISGVFGVDGCCWLLV